MSSPAQRLRTVLLGAMLGCILLGILLVATRKGGYPLELKAQADLYVLVRRFEAFYEESGRLPSEEEAHSVLLDPALADREAVVRDVARDPWGRPYIYRFVSSNEDSAQFEVRTEGPDGVEGTTDDLAMTILITHDGPVKMRYEVSSYQNIKLTTTHESLQR